MPELTTRFNEQGEAIGFVGGKLKDTKRNIKNINKMNPRKFYQKVKMIKHMTM